MITVGCEPSRLCNATLCCAWLSLVSATCLRLLVPLLTVMLVLGPLSALTGGYFSEPAPCHPVGQRAIAFVEAGCEARRCLPRCTPKVAARLCVLHMPLTSPRHDAPCRLECWASLNATVPQVCVGDGASPVTLSGYNSSCGASFPPVPSVLEGKCNCLATSELGDCRWFKDPYAAVWTYATPHPMQMWFAWCAH